jgi:fructokinase
MLFQLARLQQHDLSALDMEAWTDMAARANRAGARTCTFLGAMEAFRQLSKDIFE